MQTQIIFKNVKVEGLKYPVSIKIKIALNTNTKIKKFECKASFLSDTSTHILIPNNLMHWLDTYSDLKDNKTFQTIYNLYKKYNKNVLHAGSPKQEALIKEAINSNLLKDYTNSSVISYLKSKRCYIDEDCIIDGKPYVYGTKWLTFDIPEEDLELIKTIIKQKGELK